MFAHLAFLALAASSPGEGRDAQIKCAAVLKEQAARMRGQALILLTDAKYAETHNNEFSPEMTQRYIDWYRKRQAAGEPYPELSATVLSPTARHQRQRSIADFLDHEKRERENFDAGVRASLIKACPWKAAEIRSKSWPEGL